MTATSGPARFLSLIVDKARGAASPIAPRLPSLFEPPAPGMAPPMWEEMPHVRRAAPTPRGASPLPPDPQLPPTSVRLEPAQPVEPSSGDEVRPRSPDTRQTEAGRIPFHPLAGRAEPGRIANPDSNSAEGPFPVRSAATIEPHIAETHPGIDPGFVDAREPRRPLGPSASAVPDTHAGALQPDATAVRLARSAAPESLAARRPGTLEPSATTLPASTEPVINVTIGRVEVRAVPAPAAKPHNEPSRPRPMSLDDYLKQRGRR